MNKFSDLLEQFSFQTAEEDNNLVSIMSITGIRHMENVWSSIYAYFLDETQSHELSKIFQEGLERIIYRKTGRIIKLNGCIIQREYSTNRNNRIDLLIQTPTQSVIIENKVFHHLDNDLDDYWLSVRGSDDSKVGIVLTISHILTNNPHYINITHLEWINEIKCQIIASNITINPTINTLLKDFMMIIKQTSGDINYSESKSYLDNRNNFNKLYSTASNYWRWLQSVFADSAFIKSLGFTLVHNEWVGSKYRYAMYLIPGTDELVITVFYEHLWNSIPGKARLYLFLQPIGKLLEKAIAHEEEIRLITEEEGVPSRVRHKDYWHCAAMEIEVAEEDLLNESALKNYLIEHLASNNLILMKVANRILNILSSTHLPTYQWIDVEKKLNELLPADQEENSLFWVSPINFIMYDCTNKVVVLEVIDNLFRSIIEANYYDSLMSALRYGYGDDVKCSIICKQIHT